MSIKSIINDMQNSLVEEYGFEEDIEITLAEGLFIKLIEEVYVGAILEELEELPEWVKLSGVTGYTKITNRDYKREE